MLFMRYKMRFFPQKILNRTRRAHTKTLGQKTEHGNIKKNESDMVISDFKAKNRLPLIGCEDSLDVTLDSDGKLTSALFSTSQLTISGGDSTVYNLSAGFSEARKPIAKNGQYFFDAITYSVRSCSDLTKNATSINAVDYVAQLREKMDKISEK